MQPSVPRAAKQAPSHPQYNTRIAPTPSGYLHEGTAFNFVLTWVRARRWGGTVRLRIDDADQHMVRPEFVDDIFRTLEWLGLDWDRGPTSADSLLREYSQQLRYDRYNAILQQLINRNQVFACSCTRRDVQLAGGQYPGTCRSRNLDPSASANALRAIIHDGPIPFPVVRSKHRVPAYMLVSVVDDVDHDITHIVRGEDLLPVSATQGLLSQLVPELHGFGRVEVEHHPLILDATGAKLSKSQGSSDVRGWRQSGRGPEAILQRVATYLALPEANAIRTVSELLEAHQATRSCG